ncbi:MAG: ABC transporter permease [Geodermatophilaceae bacterium]|nr:ABC transporter permease [Geodermatophilaceae bacterium]
MSTSTLAAGGTLDFTGTRAVPLSRLIGVELRKLGDTRAGKWLLIGIAAITVAVITIFFLTANESDRTFLNFVGITATPQGFLLPVLGVLLVTSEWTQRTGLVTFSLVPHRGRVVAAKVAASLIAGAAAIALALLVATAATVIGGSPEAWSGIGAHSFGKFGLLQVMGVLQGLALGLLFLNSAAAIVTYFVLPTAVSIVAALWTALSDVWPWVDLGTAQQPLFSGGDLTGEQWSQLGVATLIWVALPFALGVVRVLRAEIK